MFIVSKDAMTFLRLAKGCCCSNIRVLRFFELPSARRTPAAWRETARTLGRRYFATMTARLRKDEIRNLFGGFDRAVGGSNMESCPPEIGDQAIRIKRR